MDTGKVNYKEAFEGFDAQKFCDQFARVLSKDGDYEYTIEAVPKAKSKEDAGAQ